MARLRKGESARRKHDGGEPIEKLRKLMAETIDKIKRERIRERYDEYKTRS